MKKVMLNAQYIERHKDCRAKEETWSNWSIVENPENRIEELKEISFTNFNKYQIAIEYVTTDGQYAGFLPGIYIVRGNIVDNQTLLMF